MNDATTTKSASVTSSTPTKNDARTNVVLIGMPGAGKSTVGVVLAKILGMDFLDGDLLIQKQEESTLQHIIDTQGVDGFISVENNVLVGIDVERTVIAPGGSCIYSDEAMQHLASIGRVVYLFISLDELKRRLGDLRERGVVLRSGESMGLDELFAEREPLYQRYAEVTIDANGMDITTTARAVAEAIGARGAQQE